MKPWQAAGLIGRVALSGEKLHLKHIFTHSDGIWGLWGPWSSCSVTCGSGTQSRSRACDSPAQAFGGADCVGSATDLLSCNQVPCSSEHLELTPLKHFPHLFPGTSSDWRGLFHWRRPTSPPSLVPNNVCISKRSPHAMSAGI